jgi:hypothetical protein
VVNEVKTEAEAEGVARGRVQRSRDGKRWAKQSWKMALRGKIRGARH